MCVLSNAPVALALVSQQLAIMAEVVTENRHRSLLATSCPSSCYPAFQVCFLGAQETRLGTIGLSKEARDSHCEFSLFVAELFVPVQGSKEEIPRGAQIARCMPGESKSWVTRSEKEVYGAHI